MHRLLNISVVAGIAVLTPFLGGGQLLARVVVVAMQAATQSTATPDKQSPSAGNGKSQTDSYQTTGQTAVRTTAIPRKKRSLVPIQSAAPPPPKKTVIRQGGVAEPSAQVVTDMDPAEAARKRTDSDRLLSLADENLKRLGGRTLTEQQQETVSQIDHYMTVARSALKEGDISRGHTLALKASLLAQDLEKHQ
jgi:hypothetical protein